MRLVLLGAPGSGKGTQGSMLAERYGIPQVSTGDLFRMNIAEGTPLGKKVSEYTTTGRLVPDDVVLSMVSGRLDQVDAAKGFVLDGFPRTEAQADGLTRLLSERGTRLDAVLLIDVPDAAIVDRLSARRTCSKCGAIYNMRGSPPKKEGVCDRCGGKLTLREDDVPETIQKRLDVYHQMTAPLISYYEDEGLLRAVDGTKAPDVVARAIADLLAPAVNR